MLTCNNFFKFKNLTIKRAFLISSTVIATLTTPLAAQNLSTPNFNETFVNTVNDHKLDVENHETVLEYILTSMDQTITVYPSEGYYYFDFFANGEWIRGNLRFDAEARDAGNVDFTYFTASPIGEISEAAWFHKTLGPEDKLKLTKIKPFTYTLSWRNHEKQIAIYDAKYEREHPPKLAPSEDYVGPSFDESGVRFHLIFNHDHKSFAFFLNSDLGYPESYQMVEENENLLVGTRTGFVFLKEEITDRMRLIGVNRSMIENNSYYDGPFDQLPDSFLDPTHFRDLIILSDPKVENQIGARGIYHKDTSTRYSISPYTRYDNPKELLPFLSCEAQNEGYSEFDQCMNDMVYFITLQSYD